MSGIEKVLVTITIDTECDHDPNWVRSKPLRFESIYVGLPDRLQPVFRTTRAVPTYLLTVEVMEDETSAETCRNLQGEHELGTHLHSAFIEPEKKFFDYAGVDSPDFQCHCTPEVEQAKLQNLTDLFIRRFGRRPRSFRAGRYGAGNHTLPALGRLEYTVDTSVTPHIRWPHPDGALDYRGAPEQPYHPDPGRLARPAAGERRGVLEVPVTMRPRVLRGPRWFRPWFSTTEQMKGIARYHLSRYRDHRVLVLNVMFHSMEVIAKATPYPQTEDDVKRYLDSLEALLRWCRSEGFVFAGLSEVPPALDKTRPASDAVVRSGIS